MSGKGSGKKKSKSTTKCNMKKRNEVAKANDLGSNYTPKEQSIIDSYTPTIKMKAKELQNDTHLLQLVINLMRWRVAVSSGMDQGTFDLMLLYFTTCTWYQTEIGSSVSSRSHLRLSNPFHILTKLIRRPDLEPMHPTKLPLGPSTDAFRNTCNNLYHRIILHLVDKLGMHPVDESSVVIRAMRYLTGTGIGFHPDSDKKVGDTTFSMRLIVGIGNSRKITFKLVEFNLEDPSLNPGGLDITGAMFDFSTSHCGSAYLMPPDMSGKKWFCYTDEDEDEKKTMAAQAQHAVSRLGEKKHGGVLVIDFQLRSEEAVNYALNQQRGSIFGL